MILTLTDRTGGSPRPIAELFDPAAVPIDTLSLGDTGDRHTLGLQASGTYTVYLREAGDDQAVSYNLALQKLFPLTSGDCIAYGSVVQDPISPVTDTDILIFDGTAGTTIELTLTDVTGGSPTPVAEVYDPDELLATTLSNPDGADSWNVVLPKTGTYLVLIGESGDDQTVSYNIGLQCIFGPCPPCPLIQVERTSWGRVKSAYR